MRHGLVMVVLMVTALPVLAGKAEDKAAIQETVMNYIEGWYESDPEKMASAMHPNLVKCTPARSSHKGGEFLLLTTAEQLTAYAAVSQGHTEEMPFKADITVLYQNERMAMVKLDSHIFYDCMGLMKLNGTWKIVQVMWAYHEPPPAKSAG